MTWATVAYLLAGQVLGGAGVALVLAALLGDRLRGNHRRRLCPRCRYDMVGTGSLTCPECGKTVRREAGLYRSRKRWGWAGAAGVLVLAGPVVAMWPWLSWATVFPMLPARVQAEVWPWHTDEKAVVRWYDTLKWTDPEMAPVVSARLVKSLDALAPMPDFGRLSLLAEMAVRTPSSPALDAALGRLCVRSPVLRIVHLQVLLKHPGSIEAIAEELASSAAFGATEEERTGAVTLLSVIADRNETAASTLGTVVASEGTGWVGAVWALVAGLPFTRPVVDELLGLDRDPVNWEVLRAMRAIRSPAPTGLTGWAIAAHVQQRDGASVALAGLALLSLAAQADPVLAAHLHGADPRERLMLVRIVSLRAPTHDPSLLATLRNLAMNDDAPAEARTLALGAYNRAVRENRLAIEPLAVEGIREPEEPAAPAREDDVESGGGDSGGRGASGAGR